MPLIINKTEKQYQYGIWHIEENTATLKHNLNHIKIMPEMKNESRIKQWLAARNVLHVLLPEAAILNGKSGKPHFTNHDLHLSVTHCKDIAAAVISKNKCGIDLEFYSDKAQRIAAKFLNEGEKKMCKTTNEFTFFWMAKEAVYKAFGENGITFSKDISIKSIYFNKNDEAETTGIIQNKEKAEQYQLYFKRTTNFAYCVAVEDAA